MTDDALIRHIEHFLGEMASGYSPFRPGTGPQVGVFRDAPEPGANTLVTLGLSRHVLQLPRGRVVRQELVTCADAAFAVERLAVFLAALAEPVLRTHRALLRGHVVELAEAVVPQSPMRHAYVTTPSLFPEAFAELGSTEPPTVLSWVIPITEDEACFVNEHGWDRFEHVLDAGQPDLYDLLRPSVPAGE